MMTCFILTCPTQIRNTWIIGGTKFEGTTHFKGVDNDNGLQYADNNELRSLASSGDDDAVTKIKRYREFHEPHDLKVPIELECGLLFTNSCAVKRVLRALAADFQPFSLCLGNKTTFCFPIKKYPTIDSLTFPYIN
jgi:hypothetical protein